MQKVGTVALASPALMPALGPIICLGLVGAALITLLEKDDNGSGQSSDDEVSTAGQKTASMDSSSPPKSDNSSRAIDGNPSTDVATDPTKQELIRQAMSELGKRSGAARAKKIKS